ncbi:ERF family protein [Sulfitobacter mediterraneus]|uniref:ERF family protein n=1 Tax=Sulfitobacter mediterraneus TaxID=83219 RepID=UPI001939BA4D|nr:ERF family protein [Sulfitobacter mediterraneus]MBM1556696.1 ERF family protein [Sulfitobacter mediterraneus]MBM1570107.1 ERF family protein [Sulfitobacter mediterraneus]MBM1574064.1 ERF family protein [Sulfitobacter mediterraneus]MBM1577849.1 ERF family protein [Sulfitobacter mediterraneus]MBM1579654.1 ERF family protein [Sulfitobacter mediterraneus]
MNAVTKTEPEHLLPADPMVSMIERVAMDPNSDLAKLERMLELKEKHDAQNAKAEFAAAFAKASASFPTIPLNGVGHNKMPYATLEDITKYTRPVLSEHGLALTFAIDVKEQVVVTAKLMHKAGHCEETSMALPRDTSGSKNAVQAVGSTQKYGQRYTAQAILGLSLGQDDEDDGRGSAGATIDGDQIAEIESAIEAIGIDVDVILKAERLTVLHELPASKFDAVMKNLRITADKRGVKL